MIFKSRKGLSQAKKYNKKAKEFWKAGEERMIGEVMDFFKTGSDEKLLRISRNYSNKIGFKELLCSKDEIEELRKIIKHFGKEIVITDFVRYATRTGFLTVVVAPALAAAEGIGGIRDDVINEWLYGIGICLPVSADVCDSVIDGEVLKHPLIPYRTWIICHKLGAAIIFHIALKHVEKINTGKKDVDRKIKKRLLDGLSKVSKKQKMDFKAQQSSKVSLDIIEKIYDGKICEIEATVFGTIPSDKLDLVKIFEEGARNFAGELQVVDDIEDLLGDTNLGKEPTVPNPSYFLTYCKNMWDDGNRNLKKIVGESMKKTLERGEKYHEKVVKALDKLPKKFPTRPFFEMTTWYYHRVLKDKVKEFKKGETYPVIEPKLKELLK